MAAAQQLFLRQGVAPTTIEQITMAADVAKGTFYLYFSSKDDVLAALGDRFAQKHRARIAAAVDELPPDDWPGRLSAWAHAGVDSYLDSIRVHDMLFLGTRPTTREGLVDNIAIDHLAEMLQAGVTAGAWKLDDARFAAVFLFSGLHAVVDDAYGREKKVDRARLTWQVERLYFRTAGLPFGR